MSVPAFRFQLSDFSFSWVAYCLWCAGSFLTDYEAALWHTASGLGDIDTNCAIVGGIVASRVGLDGIPAEWRQHREPLPTWPFVDGAQPDDA